jgi:protein-S-isoprenylcysteine O-methyltransferase Ste14
MNDAYWRLIIIVLACVAGTVRASFDMSHMSRESRRDWLLQVIKQLLGAAIVLQLCGFDPMPMNLNFAQDTFVRCTGVVLGAFAAVMVVWPRLARRTWSGPMTLPDQIEGHELATRGPYTYVRHPFYLSGVTAFASVELATASYLLFFIVPLVTAIAVIVIGEEERQLGAVYGNQFAAYKERSWRLVPLIY